MRALLAVFSMMIIGGLTPALAGEEESPPPPLSGSLPPSIIAAEEDGPQPGLSGSIALRTDYVKTGASQTSGHPSVQGSLTWTHRSGFYVTGFISNIDLLPGDPVFAEVDLQGGYAGSFQGFGYSLGVTRYSYPRARRPVSPAKAAFEPALSASDVTIERPDSVGILPAQITGGHYDFTEVFGSVTRPTPLGEITLSVVHSPNNTGDTGAATNAAIGVKWHLLDKLSADANVTYNWIAARVGPSFPDWAIGLTYDFGFLAADLRYLRAADRGCGGHCETHVVLSLLKTF